MCIIIVIVSPQQLKANVAPLLVIELSKGHSSHFDTDLVLAQDSMVFQRIVVFFGPLFQTNRCVFGFLRVGLLGNYADLLQVLVMRTGDLVR